MSNWISKKEAENMIKHVPMNLLENGYEIVQLEGKEGFYIKLNDSYLKKGIGYKYALGEGVVTGITFSIALIMVLLCLSSFQDTMNFLTQNNSETILSEVGTFHMVFIFLVFTLLGFVGSIFTPNKMHEINHIKKHKKTLDLKKT